MDLIISSEHIEYPFPSTFKVNLYPKSCNNLVIIINNKSDLKKLYINYKKLFIIDNSGLNLGKEIKQIFGNYSRIITKTSENNWKDIFGLINKEQKVLEDFDVNVCVVVCCIAVTISLIIISIIMFCEFKSELNKMKEKLTITDTVNGSNHWIDQYISKEVNKLNRKLDYCDSDKSETLQGILCQIVKNRKWK